MTLGRYLIKVVALFLNCKRQLIETNKKSVLFMTQRQVSMFQKHFPCSFEVL